MNENRVNRIERIADTLSEAAGELREMRTKPQADVSTLRADERLQHAVQRVLREAKELERAWRG